MSETMTLSAYLSRRGKKAKALKRCEAEAFGIPWPLRAGWPWRYGAMEITAAMLEDAERRIQLAKHEARRKTPTMSVEPVPAALSLLAIHGFALRQARRYRARKPVPRA